MHQCPPSSTIIPPVSLPPHVPGCTPTPVLSCGELPPGNQFLHFYFLCVSISLCPTYENDHLESVSLLLVYSPLSLSKNGSRAWLLPDLLPSHLLHPILVQVLGSSQGRNLSIATPSCTLRGADPTCMPSPGHYLSFCSCFALFGMFSCFLFHLSCFHGPRIKTRSLHI